MTALPTQIDKDREVTLKLSGNENLYYIPEFAGPHSFWLTTKTFESADEKEASKRNIFQPHLVKITKTDGKTYYRNKYSFLFFDVDSGKEVKVKMSDDRVLDYLLLERNNRKV
jgi:hypothetical protein